MINAGPDHSLRINVSSERLASAITEQARSLARFPVERMEEAMVTYDLLSLTVFHALMELVGHQPETANRLIDQLATELHLLVEEMHLAPE